MKAESEAQRPDETMQAETTVQEFSRHAAIRRIQEEVRKLVPEGVSLAYELIADRRAEAERENAE